MNPNAVIKVILRSGATIDSPIMPRADAEKDLEQINGARVQADEISLSWLSVLGGDVEAAHLVERAAPQMPRSG